ncbi:uncharacterized protein LOC129597460 isoform X2 [Paramacrobiotus metropolitanus]|nr:uncharacterized protein LOC129597460 isoform X2 [Paramacrobiotus metropolitanus]
MANLPLLFYETCIVACVDYAVPGMWKVAVISLQFLRLFCLIWFCDEIIRIFPNLPLKIGTIMRRITWIACCFLSCAAWIQLVEILGDFWLPSYNGQQDLSYGRVVTFLYGKLVFLDVTTLQLQTTAAKVSVYIVQAITLIFLVQIIPEMLKQLPKILKIRAFDTVYRRRDTKYVALLGSVNPSAVERFAKRFRSTNPGENIAVLLEPEASDPATEEMNTVAGKYRDILTVVSGSVFNKQDLNNVISKHCQCAFFFANESAPNFTVEDHCNFLRVHALKQHHPQVRVIVKVLLFNNKERFYDIPNWRKETPDSSVQVDGIVCTAELQFSLLAQRYFAPGISQIIYEWFSKPAKKRKGIWQSIRKYWNSSADTRPGVAENVERWLGRSGRQTIRSIVYHTSMEKSIDNRRPRSTASTNAQDVPMQQIHNGVAANDNPQTPLNETRLDINGTPTLRPKTIRLYKDIEDKFKEKGTLFAVLQEGVFHLYPRENLIVKDGAKLFFITSASVNQLQKTLCSNCFDSKKIKLGLACDQPDKDLVTLPKSSTGNMIPWLNTTTAAMEENKHEIWDPSGQFRHYQSPKRAIPLKCADEKDSELSTLEHHVVICVISDSSSTNPIGLVNFIKPLRSIHAVPPVVVILGDAEFLIAEWDSLSDFPNIFPVKGTPLSDNHLRAINVQASRMCLVVDASERPKEESEKWSQSANADLVLPILPKHFYRHVNAVLATVAITEYLKRSSERKDPLIEHSLKVIEEILKKCNVLEGELQIEAALSVKAQLKAFRMHRDQSTEKTLLEMNNLLEATEEARSELLEFLKRIRQASDAETVMQRLATELCQGVEAVQPDATAELKEIVETYRRENQRIVQEATERVRALIQTVKPLKVRHHEDVTDFILSFSNITPTRQTIESAILDCFSKPTATDPLPEHLINDVSGALQHRNQRANTLETGYHNLLVTLCGNNEAVIQKAETLLRGIRCVHDPTQERCTKIMEDFTRSCGKMSETSHWKLLQLVERFREENFDSLQNCAEQIGGIIINPFSEEAKFELIRFLKQFRETCDPLPEEILTCIHHEAVGLISWNQTGNGHSANPKVLADCTMPTIVDAFMLKCYEDKDIFDAVRLLLLGCYCDTPKHYPEKRVSGYPYLGNQAALSKLTFSSTLYSTRRIWRGLRKYNPLSADVDRCPLNGQPDTNEKAELSNGETLQSLSQTLKQKNLLILAPEASCLKRKARNNQHYFALERPFYVVARQKLFAKILVSFSSDLDENADKVLSLEFLPPYILKAVAEKNSGLPKKFSTYHHQDWFFAYYRVMDQAAKSSTSIPAAMKAAFGEMSPDPAKYHKATGLPKLPKSVLSFVLATYYHKKLSQKPSPESTIPANEFFYKRNAPVEADQITWNDLALLKWND